MASSLPAVANVTGFLSGSAILNPKNPIFIQLNPKFDRKLNLWSFYNQNIIHLWILRTFYTLNIQFYKFYHQIRFLTLISNSHEQQQNYMLNSGSELYHLRLDNISPPLTLDWWLQDSIGSLFSWFSSSPLSPKDFCKPNLSGSYFSWYTQQIF